MTDKTIHFQWDLPETLVDGLSHGTPDMTEAIKQAAVLDWVRMGRISLRLGAELLGMTYQAFMDLMALHHIPTLEYEEGWEQGTALFKGSQKDGASS